jgi:hypothetical protein
MPVLLIFWRNNQKIVITFSGTPIGATGEFPGQVISIILRILVNILSQFQEYLNCWSLFKFLMDLKFIIKFIGRILFLLCAIFI